MSVASFVFLPSSDSKWLETQLYFFIEVIQIIPPKREFLYTSEDVFLP